MAIITVERLIRAIHPLNDLLSYVELKRHLQRLKPDVVHTHSAKAGILGRFAGHAFKGVWAANRPGVVHTIHGLAFHPYQRRWLNHFYIAAEKATARRTDSFISVADAMTEQALAAGIGRPDQYVTAYSAIEEDDFLRPVGDQRRREFRLEHGIGEDAVVLVTIARLFTLKGHEYIIESAKELAARFQNAVWLFVGDGILSAQYRQQVERLGLAGRFRFTGLLPPGEIPLAIQSSDILVHCSLREGLARALPQGMLCGKPVASLDVDGAREVVNENTGRLIEPKNIGQLTEACAELLADESLRRRLGERARESVKEKFAPGRMVDMIEEVYRKLPGTGV